MSGYLTANGFRVTDLNLAVPYYGAPVADVTLAGAQTLTNPVTLTVANLTLVMALMVGADGLQRQRPFAGVTKARLVAGAGGWSKRTSLAPYRAPTGAVIMASRVLGDLAKATGESVNVQTDRVLGAFYSPEPNAPAGRELAWLAGALWWIDTAGVTQIAAARPSSAIGTKALVERHDGGSAWLTVSTEDVKSWCLPGATYTSAQVPYGLTIASTRVRSSNSGVLRVEVLTT
jgi:hypothetical protein